MCGLRGGKLTVHRRLYKDQHQDLVLGENRTVWKQSEMFILFDDLMRNKAEAILPSCSADNSLARKFVDFLMRKSEIRNTIYANIFFVSETVVMVAEARTSVEYCHYECITSGVDGSTLLDHCQRRDI